MKAEIRSDESFDSPLVRRSDTILTVHPPGGTAAASTLPLGILDQFVFAFIPVVVIYTYPATAGGDAVPLDRLKDALERLLALHPFLGGRLVGESGGRRRIERFGAGAALVTATCSARLPAAPSLFDLPAAGNALAPLPPPADGADAEDAPVLMLQHTRFACGGAAVCVRLLHAVGDAAAAVQLTADLACLYRGEAVAPRTVCPYLTQPLSPRAVPAACPNPAYRVGDPAPALTSFPPPPVPVIGRALYLSEATQRGLVAAATSGDGDGWVSTFEAVGAWLLRLSYQARARISPGTAPSDSFLAPINLRGVLGLGAGYLFNGSLVSTAAVDRGLLTGDALAPIAAAIHRLVRAPCNTETSVAQETVTWLAAQKDPSCIGTSFTPGGLQLSAWNKFDLYGAATLDDRPTLAVTPFTHISLMDGLCYVLPSSAPNSRDAIIYAAFAEDVWAELEKDETISHALKQQPQL